MKNNLLLSILLLTTLVLTACNGVAGQGASFASIPAGAAYAEGEVIYFAHTEASDAGIAKTLTDMMKSPVLYVPSLTQVPETLLAKVYVFENGVKGTGPLGFQPDVFDNPPSMPDKYTPLRRLVTAKWNEATPARELKSAAEVLAAVNDGELTLATTDVVINMPFLTWSGGKR